MSRNNRERRERSRLRAIARPGPSVSEITMARAAAIAIDVDWKEPRIKNALLDLIQEAKTHERERLRAAFAWRGVEPASETTTKGGTDAG